jgi:hypothetical protein
MEVQHPPEFDEFDPLIAKLFARLREQTFGAGKHDEDKFGTAVKLHFRMGLVQPWGRAFWRDVYSGDWRLGRNDQRIGASLGFDAKGVSRGLNEGILTTEILVLCLAARAREPDCLPSIRQRRGDMLQSGYIEALRYARVWLARDPNNKTQKGNEEKPQLKDKAPLEPWDYELLVLIHRNLRIWIEHHRRCLADNGRSTPAYQEFAASLVAELIASERFPSHLDEADRREAQAELQHLHDPAGYLEHLANTWHTTWWLTMSKLDFARRIIR